MQKFYKAVCTHRKTILSLFLILTVICFFLKDLVSVDYDLNDYLPADTPSTVAIDVMEKSFEGGIPNARVMVRDVSIPEALSYKSRIENVSGVESVTWLDDSVSVEEPLDTLDQSLVESTYKDGNALFTVTLEEHSRISGVEEIRSIVGENGALTGSAVSTADATTNTVSEIQKITIIAVLFVLFVLTLTTRSWAEPVIVMIGLGVAILINSGTNLIFGKISFVTNAAGSILQFAVSLDYSVFLIHRFEECLKEAQGPEDAMVTALMKSASSILSSGLTTVIGFLALILMRFEIGADLGIALAKGVSISLICVFVFMPALILSTRNLMVKTRHRKFLPSFKRFGAFVMKVTLPLGIVFVLLIPVSYLASNANDYYYGSSHIFGDSTRYGSDTEAIEAVFGEKDSYVLMVPEGSTAKEKELSDNIKALPHVESVLSYVDTAGPEVPASYLPKSALEKLASNGLSRMVITADVPYEGEETFSLVENLRKTAGQSYPDSYYLAGEGVSTYDLRTTVTQDMVKVNLVAILAVYAVLVFTLKSLFLPLILVLSIETAIWLNLSIPYFMGTPIFYIAYLIISSIQLGATVDYAILMTDRYKENRASMGRKEALIHTVAGVTPSILTSGSALTVVGLLLGYISSNQLLAQLGIFIGRGAIFSLIIVLFVLPGLLYRFDRLVVRENKNEPRNKHREILSHETP